MLRNRQTSLQELLNQENLLTKLNRELIKTIQDMEASSAQKVRETLQQQDILGVSPSESRSPASTPCTSVLPTAPQS